jgi:hypothetical protein
VAPRYTRAFSSELRLSSPGSTNFFLDVTGWIE